MDESERVQTLFSNLVEGIRQEHKWPFRSRARRKVPNRAMRTQEVSCIFGDQEMLRGGDRPQRLAQISKGKTGTQNSESIAH